MKVILIILAFVLLGMAFVWLSPPSSNTVCVDSSCFTVELAVTADERSRGLMGIEHMDQDHGMLFVFPEEGNYGFWMKDTMMPLDIIWIDSSKRIVKIARNSQPCIPDACPTISPGADASYVLEINGGLSDRLGISEGDVAEINIHSMAA